MADNNKMNHDDDDLEFDVNEFDTDAFEAEDLEIDEFEAEDLEAMDAEDTNMAPEMPGMYDDAADDDLSLDNSMHNQMDDDLQADLVEEYSDALEGELDDPNNAFYDDGDDAQWDDALDNMDDMDGLDPMDDMSMDGADPAAGSSKKDKKAKKAKKERKSQKPANDGDNPGRKKAVSAAFWGLIAVVVGGGLYVAFSGGSSTQPNRPSRPAPATQDAMDPSQAALGGAKIAAPAPTSGGLLNDPTRLSARAGITPDNQAADNNLGLNADNNAPSAQGSSLLSNIGIPQPGAPENTGENTDAKSQDSDIAMIAPDTMPVPQANAPLPSPELKSAPESTRRVLPSETIPRADNVAVPDVPKLAPPKVDTAQLPSQISGQNVSGQNISGTNDQGNIRVALDPNNPIIKNLQVDIAQLKSQDKNLDVKMSDISKQIMTLQDTLNRQIDVLKTSAAANAISANSAPAIDQEKLAAQVTENVTQQVSQQISKQLSEQLAAIQDAANQAANAAQSGGADGNAAALNQAQLTAIQQNLAQLSQRLDGLEGKITGVNQDMASLKQLSQDAKLAADQAKTAAKMADTMALDTSSGPSTQPVVTASLADKPVVKKAPPPSYAPKTVPPAPSFKPNAPARFATNTSDKLNQVVNNLGQSGTAQTRTSQASNPATSLYPATLSGQNAGTAYGSPYSGEYGQQRASAQDFWLLRAAQRGRAWVSPISNRAELKEITLGDTVQGLGQVTSIEKINGQWVVQGTLSILQ